MDLPLLRNWRISPSLFRIEILAAVGKLDILCKLSSNGICQFSTCIFHLFCLCFCHSDVLRSHNRQSWFEVQRFTSTSSVSSSSPRQQITATSTTILLLQLSKSNYLRSKSYNHYTLIHRSVRVTYKVKNHLCHGFT